MFCQWLNESLDSSLRSTVYYWFGLCFTNLCLEYWLRIDWFVWMRLAFLRIWSNNIFSQLKRLSNRDSMLRSIKSGADSLLKRLWLHWDTKGSPDCYSRVYKMIRLGVRVSKNKFLPTYTLKLSKNPFPKSDFSHIPKISFNQELNLSPRTHRSDDSWISGNTNTNSNFLFDSIQVNKCLFKLKIFSFQLSYKPNDYWHILYTESDFCHTLCQNISIRMKKKNLIQSYLEKEFRISEGLIRNVW